MFAGLQYIRQVISRFISNECALNVTCLSGCCFSQLRKQFSFFFEWHMCVIPYDPCTHLVAKECAYPTVHGIVMLWWCYRFLLQCLYGVLSKRLTRKTITWWDSFFELEFFLSSLFMCATRIGCLMEWLDPTWSLEISGILWRIFYPNWSARIFQNFST
jgi:hypothetical protein